MTELKNAEATEPIEDDFKSAFARSVALNSSKKHKKEIISKPEKFEKNGMPVNEDTRLNSVGAVSLPEIEVARLRKECQSLMNEKRRNSGKCLDGLTSLPVETYVVQSQMNTLRWQLQQTESNRQMYRNLIMQMANFLERAQESLNIIQDHLPCNAKTSRKYATNATSRRNSLSYVPRNGRETAQKPYRDRGHPLSRAFSTVHSDDRKNGNDEEIWTKGKLTEIPLEHSPAKLAQEAHRLKLTARTLLETKEPDLINDRCLPSIAPSSAPSVLDDPIRPQFKALLDPGIAGAFPGKLGQRKSSIISGAGSVQGSGSSSLSSSSSPSASYRSNRSNCSNRNSITDIDSVSEVACFLNVGPGHSRKNPKRSNIIANGCLDEFLANECDLEQLNLNVNTYGRGNLSPNGSLARESREVENLERNLLDATFSIGPRHQTLTRDNVGLILTHTLPKLSNQKRTEGRSSSSSVEDESGFSSMNSFDASFSSRSKDDAFNELPTSKPVKLPESRSAKVEKNRSLSVRPTQLENGIPVTDLDDAVGIPVGVSMGNSVGNSIKNSVGNSFNNKFANILGNSPGNPQVNPLGVPVRLSSNNTHRRWSSNTVDLLPRCEPINVLWV